MTVPAPDRPALPTALVAALAALAGALAAAWVSDDGMVTFRTVENLAAGDGFRWNVAERTQTATHPLWIALLAACRWLTGELYVTAIALSLLCATGAAFLVARGARSTAAAVVAVPIAMLSSRTWVEYATGGLENPLVYLLVAWFAAVWFDDAGRPPAARLRRLGWLAALLVLARIDLVLLVLPCVLAAGRGVPWQRAGLALLPGALLLAGWILFATIYFGTPIPTPGYAKALALDVPAAALALQGLRYLWDLCWRDPASALVLLAAIGLAVQSRRARYLAPAAGLVLQLLYTLKVGGDFMAGRFFSAALMLALAVLARALSRREAAVLGVALPAAALLAPGWPPWLQVLPPPHEARIAHGISDERSYYAAELALWSDRRQWPDYGAFTRQLFPDRRRPMVALRHAVGLDSLKAGPLVHMVEPWICDPLLVRLPLGTEGRWRIGHFTRRLPEGYLETLATGEIRIHHPALAEYYRALRSVLRDPVLDGDRLQTLWGMLTGRYDALLARYVQEEYRAPPLVEVAAGRLAAPVPPGALWFDVDQAVVVREGGVRAALPAPAPDGARRLILTVDGSGAGEVRLLRGGAPAGRVELTAATFGAADVALDVPPAAAGFDAFEVHLRPVTDPAVTVLDVFALLAARIE